MAGEDLQLDFLVAYPRVAEVGKKYLMTVDLRVRGAAQAWPYEEEEYPLYLMVDSEPAFTNEPVGQGTVVLHRFGGTYGPAKFVLTARKPTEKARVSISLVNSAGLSLRKQQLPDVRVVPAVEPMLPPRPRRTPKVAPPGSIGWLHLSNLMMVETWPDEWERALAALLKDLERLAEKSGPWDLVLCSGDLTLRGWKGEFDSASRVLDAIQERLEALGMSPWILAVPGNHDLNRRSKSWELLKNLREVKSIDLASSPMREDVDRAFQNYLRWWEGRSAPLENNLRRGLLPGDFSTVFERGDVRLGIVGLNNVLEAGRNAGTLRAQLADVCEGGFDEWSRGLDACVLLTHEPPRVLEEQWPQRVAGGPFLLHLTGRASSKGSIQVIHGGLPTASALEIHGRNLFPGNWDEMPQAYLAGRISFERSKGRVRLWPRIATLSKSGLLRIEADRHFFDLEADEGVEAAAFTRPSSSAREAREDWAVVVGIDRYPELTDVEGAQRDALAFRDWLIEQAHVPQEHVSEVLSSSFPPSESSSEAKPGPEEVEALFVMLASLVMKNRGQGGRGRVGRRLYLYFSGHGGELTGGELVLLTSNASPDRFVHIAPRAYAEWFRRTGSFDEVFLFVDCDRQAVGNAPLRLPRFQEAVEPEGPEGRGFYAMAPRFQREFSQGQGWERGAFTARVLSGLTGAASDEEGRVTARSLANYLLEAPGVAASEEQPEISYSEGASAEFEIVRVPPKLYPLELRVEQRLIGRRVELLTEHLKRVDEFQAATPSRLLHVPQGNYLVSVQEAGTAQAFGVHEATVVELSEERGQLQVRVIPGGAPEEHSPAHQEGTLLLNSIDGETGQYQVPPIEPERAVRLAQEFVSFAGREIPSNFLSEPEAEPSSDEPARTWGVVFAADAPSSLREALRPLIALRSQAARSEVPIFDYRPGESAVNWLRSRGPLPYFLLLVGGPGEIPFEFQRSLSVVRAVGRLSFATDQEYSHYASSVIQYEQGLRTPSTKRVTFWGARHPGDEVSRRINELLERPLDEDLLGREEPLFREERATASSLAQALSGSNGLPSALIFAAGHGVSFRSEPMRSRYQGGLLGEEWIPFNPVLREAMVTAEDLSPTSPHSLIAFFFASFSAGTSLAEPLARALIPEGPAPSPFVAALPRQLLSNPSGGTLAVLGQVDWAWALAAGEAVYPRPHEPYRDCMTRILKGQPVGHAVRLEFGMRWARAWRAMMKPRDDSVWETELLREFLNLLDARSLVVLGDPAVRLNVEPIEDNRTEEA